MIHMYFERSGGENGEVPLEAAEFEAPKSETQKAERAALRPKLAETKEFKEIKDAATEQAASLVEGTVSSPSEQWQAFIDASVAEMTMTGVPDSVAREALAASVREIGAKKESEYQKLLSEALRAMPLKTLDKINMDTDEFISRKQELDRIQKLYKALKAQPKEQRKAA